MNDKYLEELCKQNCDPKAKVLRSVDELILSGRIPKGFEGTPTEFYASFFTREITPNMGIVEEDHYQLHFTNRTNSPVIPTDVTQIEYAKKQLKEIYSQQKYGVEDVDVDQSEVEDIPAGKYRVEFQLNPKDHFLDVYGSKPGDLYFIQGEYNNEWITGQTGLLEAGSPMPVSEKIGTLGTCYLISPKTYCPTQFYHQAMKLAYNEKRFVEEVICESDKEKFFNLLSNKVDSLKPNESIILNDFQEVLKLVSFDSLDFLLANTPGKGIIIFSDKKATMFKNFGEIIQLQEFSIAKLFVEKFRLFSHEWGHYY